MAWTWRFLGSDGEQMKDVVGQASSDAGFPTQADAETWLGEHWRELSAADVDAVTLLEDAREVYGPMSLKPPE